MTDCAGISPFLRVILSFVLLTLTMNTASAADTKSKGSKKSSNSNKFEIQTSLGDIEIELDSEKAPGTVENFLAYVDAKFYDGTIFHRVIKNFMIQGGGFTPDMNQKPTNAPIKIESSNGLKNLRGTVAMARTNDPNSATSQFFINHADNSFLDFSSPSPEGIGYTVFGKVTKGMEVVDKIASVKTGSKGYFRDVPEEKVEIKSIRRQ